MRRREWSDSAKDTLGAHKEFKRMWWWWWQRELPICVFFYRRIARAALYSLLSLLATLMTVDWLAKHSLHIHMCAHNLARCDEWASAYVYGVRVCVWREAIRWFVVIEVKSLALRNPKPHLTAPRFLPSLSLSRCSDQQQLTNLLCIH